MNKYVQVLNPKVNRYVKINTAGGIIVSVKKSPGPYKNIEIKKNLNHKIYIIRDFYRDLVRDIIECLAYNKGTYEDIGWVCETLVEAYTRGYSDCRERQCGVEE